MSIVRVLPALFLLVFIFGSLIRTVAAAPKSSSGSDLISSRPLLNSDGSLRLPANLSGSLDLRGWDVSLDPQRGPLLSREPTPLQQVTGT